MSLLWGLGVWATLVAAWLRCLIAVEGHSHEPVPDPRDRSDADQDDPERGRNGPGGSEHQHQDPGDDWRCDQEPSCGTHTHTT